MFIAVSHQHKTLYNATAYRLTFCHYLLLLILLLQPFDYLAAFQLELLQATLFIAV